MDDNKDLQMSLAVRRDEDLQSLSVHCSEIKSIRDTTQFERTFSLQSHHLSLGGHCPSWRWAPTHGKSEPSRLSFVGASYVIDFR